MMTNFPKTIAIDGPAASGKSSIGQELAAKLGYLFLDTGLMYRAVTWEALNQNIEISDENRINLIAQQIKIIIRPPSVNDNRQCDVLVNNKDITWLIRSQNVNKNVSQVSAYAGVREEMTLQQRIFGNKGNIVMVGRDIGTVVLPEADLKIYLEASAEERAQRRFKEVLEHEGIETYQEILESMRHRDEIDSQRSLAPLKPAKDAIIVSTDGKNKKQVIQEILCILKTR
jgi:cytidylate kinase